MAQTQATSGAARRQCAAILFSSWATTGPQTSENEGQYRPSAASQGSVESTPAMSLTYLSRMRSRVRVPSSPPANTNLLNHFRFFIGSILCKLGPTGAKWTQLLCPRFKRSGLFAYKTDRCTSESSGPWCDQPNFAGLGMRCPHHSRCR